MRRRYSEGVGGTRGFAGIFRLDFIPKTREFKQIWLKPVSDLKHLTASLGAGGLAHASAIKTKAE